MYRAVSADENEKNLQRRYFDKYNKMSLLPNIHYCRVEATWVGGEGMA